MSRPVSGETLLDAQLEADSVRQELDEVRRRVANVVASMENFVVAADDDQTAPTALVELWRRQLEDACSPQE